MSPAKLIISCQLKHKIDRSVNIVNVVLFTKNTIHTKQKLE